MPLHLSTSCTPGVALRGQNKQNKTCSRDNKTQPERFRLSNGFRDITDHAREPRGKINSPKKRRLPHMVWSQSNDDQFFLSRNLFNPITATGIGQTSESDYLFPSRHPSKRNTVTQIGDASALVPTKRKRDNGRLD